VDVEEVAKEEQQDTEEDVLLGRKERKRQMIKLRRDRKVMMTNQEEDQEGEIENLDNESLLIRNHKVRERNRKLHFLWPIFLLD